MPMKIGASLLEEFSGLRVIGVKAPVDGWSANYWVYVRRREMSSLDYSSRSAVKLKWWQDQ